MVVDIQIVGQFLTGGFFDMISMMKIMKVASILSALSQENSLAMHAGRFIQEENR
jgi:hypothetical protein